MPTKQSSNKSLPTLDFIGTWVSFRAAATTGEIKIATPSTWVIFPGNQYMVDGQMFQCKLKKGMLYMPTTNSKQSYWVGKLKSDGTLKISIDNGMIAYLCKRVPAQTSKK